VTKEARQRAVPIPAGQAGYLIGTAARTPSVHNTQPWRFRVGEYAIELYADQRRKLRVDPVGREMLISCGAALFGLRLAVRSLGYLLVVELLPLQGSSLQDHRGGPGRRKALAMASCGAITGGAADLGYLLRAADARGCR
jgi:hypothetical protein